MCCKVPEIPEFEKPPGIWCRHAVPQRGCGIYEGRPSICQAFYCLWMQDAGLGPEWQPTRSKFVVYLQRNNSNLQVAVDPSFPNAWTKAPYYARIKNWAQEGAEHGRFVFVRIGRRMIAVLPKADIEIGDVAAEDKIMVARQYGPTGFDYTVEVTRGGPLDPG